MFFSFLSEITCATLSVSDAKSIKRGGTADCTTTKSNHGDTCQLECNAGFERTGTSSVQCGPKSGDAHSIDGDWSASLGTCERKLYPIMDKR